MLRRRRLLLLAAVVLATSAIAAELTPRERGREAEPTVTGPSRPPAATGGTRAGAREADVTVDASARRPKVVRVRQGTLVRLVVKAPAPDEVELAGLERFAPVDEFSPARFEFFAERAGTFPIRLRESRREIGRLVVQARPL